MPSIRLAELPKRSRALLSVKPPDRVSSNANTVRNALQLASGDDTLIFLLPMPPNRGNFRGSWRKAYGEKKRYWAMLDDLALQRLIPRPPPEPYGPSTISAHFIVRGKYNDQDNIMARCKYPTDYLVTRGYLADDTPSFLHWSGLPTQSSTKGTGLDPSLELTLTINQHPANV